jgi:hypothetical protein
LITLLSLAAVAVVLTEVVVVVQVVYDAQLEQLAVAEVLKLR